MFYLIPRLTPGYLRYLQTQAAQTRLPCREAPRTRFVAAALGLVGLSMSGYSCCQLTLHCKPANHLFR